MNFAITGWGPQEYLGAVKKYAPQYKPDAIVVAFFVNDFYDAFNTHVQMQQWIGLGGRDPRGLYSFATLQNTRAWLRWDIMGRLKERMKKVPYRVGFSLGHFGAFKRDELEALTRGQERILAIARELKAASQALQSELIFLLAPASIQINARSQLDYYPRYVDFTDGDVFDTQQPQKLMRTIADRTGVPYLDLYGPLKTHADKQVYMPRNMHWTELGHRVAAEAIHDFLRRLSSLEWGIAHGGDA